MPVARDIGQVLFQLLEQAAIAEVALHIGHAAGETLPRRIVDCVDAVLAARVADEALQHLVQAVAPILGAALGDVDADDGEMLGKEARPCEIVQRGDQQSPGKVSAGAEDHHGARPGRRGLPSRGGADNLHLGWL